MSIGIYGGAFDPVHLEHINIMRASLVELNLERLIVVPTYTPPHKAGSVASFDMRVAMLEETILDNVVVDDYELKSGMVNYSLNTLNYYKQKYGDIIFIIGEDSLLTFHKWYKPEEIIKICPIRVVRREGYMVDNINNIIEEIKYRYNADIECINYIGKEVSSSRIRMLIETDGDTSLLLNNKVRKIIEKQHLYQAYRGIVKDVENRMSIKLFDHSISTMEIAFKIAGSNHLRLSFDKIFLSAMLHDIAKQEKYNKLFNIPEDAIGTPVEHQFVAVSIIKERYNIDDLDVLDAIKYHTSAKIGMSDLGKLIYCSDMVATNRVFEGVEDLRKLLYANLEEGFKACLTRSYEFLLFSGVEIYSLTKQAYEYYITKE